MIGSSDEVLRSCVLVGDYITQSFAANSGPSPLSYSSHGPERVEISRGFASAGIPADRNAWLPLPAPVQDALAAIAILLSTRFRCRAIPHARDAPQTTRATSVPSNGFARTS